MIKSKFFIIICCFVSFYGYSQDKITINNAPPLEGIIQKEDLLEPPYVYWYEKNNKDYKPEAAVVKQLQKKFKNISIKAFMGAWCQDSRLLVPKFYKLLELSDFDEDNLEMIAVNRAKKTKDNLQKGYKVTRVPTFIFYKDGKEIGRFVEYPIENLEEDLLKIVSEKPYKHPYSKQ